MAKVLGDFYYRWVKNRIQVTYDSDGAIEHTKEWVGIDTSSNTVERELPDTTGDNVLDGKEIYIIDQGNAATNNITIIPNALDSTTIEGEASYIVQKNNAIVSFKLINGTWTKNVETRPILNLGAFHMHDNVTITTINTVDTNTDIAGIAAASPLNSNFTFATSPNALTYTGIKDITTVLTISAAMSKANASDKIFKVLGMKNGAEIVGCNVATNILKAKIEVSVSYPVVLSTGDEVKIMIRNETDDENIDITDLIIIIFEA